MNRKILALLLIMIAAVTALTVVSAADTITVNGMEFNVPDGYSMDPTFCEFPYEEGGILEGNMTILLNDDDDEDSIMVGVLDNTLSESLSDSLSDGFDKEKISNKTGFLKEEKGELTFAYEDGDKVVFIYADDEDLIEEVIK
jgi:hypothetical protein